MLVRWAVEDHVAFSKVDTEAFRAMMLAVNPAIKPFLCSRMSLRRWIQKDYIIGREAVKLRLKQARSKRHVSFDIWSAPSFKYSFIGVFVHCILETPEGPKCYSIQVGLRRIRNRHVGEKVATIVLDVIREYEIEPSQLGVFIADNEETNDKAVRLILKQLYPGIKQKEILARRVRCVAHIINLAAQAFLFGKDVAAFEGEVIASSGNFNAAQMAADQDRWRKQGAQGKLHNIVQYIFSSSQRRDAWSDVSIGQNGIDKLWPVKDNTTRWNSQYEAIKTAIRLRPRLKVFIDIYRDELPKDVLTDEDWEELQVIHDSLQPFADITLAIQSRAVDGHHGSLWEWLPAIECLKNGLEAEIEAAKAAGTTSEPITVARQNAYDKLDKYWTRSDETHTLYAAATLMCPEQRLHYFNREWNTQHTAGIKNKMRAAVKKYWESNYPVEPNSEERPRKRANVFDDHLNHTLSTPTSSDEFDTYITDMPVSLPDRRDTTLLRWWLKFGTPRLQRMAFDFLSIPCTSCECERAFSSARRTITFERMSLKDETVEEVELLRSWWRQGLVHQPSSYTYDGDGDGDDDMEDQLPDAEGPSDDE